MSEGPKQIGDVVNIDRMDSIARKKLDPRIKLQLLMAEAKVNYSRDPRSGGFAIVARPRVILQLLIDLNVGPLSTTVRLNRAVVIGAREGDVVGWWEDVPLMIRCTVVNDDLWCLPLDKIPESKGIDRSRAALIRIAAHNSRLHMLRDA